MIKSSYTYSTECKINPTAIETAIEEVIRTIKVDISKLFALGVVAIEIKGSTPAGFASGTEQPPRTSEHNQGP